MPEVVNKFLFSELRKKELLLEKNKNKIGSNEMDMDIRLIFLKTMLMIMGDYNNYIFYTNDDDMTLFNNEAFIEAHSEKQMKLFLEQFIKTQLFKQFLLNEKQLYLYDKNNKKIISKENNEIYAENNYDIKDFIDTSYFKKLAKKYPEFINDPKYAKFREPLLRSKYYLAYINPSLEEGLLSNGFEIPETFYSGAQFAANITGTNNLALEMMQDVYGFPIAIENIGELLTTSDEELMDYNKATTAILRQCILRSLFLYLSTDRIKTLNVSFQQLLDDDDYKGMHPDGQKSEELIAECFEAADRDREKQKTLLFGQKPSN